MSIYFLGWLLQTLLYTDDHRILAAGSLTAAADRLKARFSLDASSLTAWERRLLCQIPLRIRQGWDGDRDGKLHFLRWSPEDVLGSLIHSDGCHNTRVLAEYLMRAGVSSSHCARYAPSQIAEGAQALARLILVGQRWVGASILTTKPCYGANLVRETTRDRICRILNWKNP